MRVLYVEDDADSREMLSLLLGQAGFEVVTASGITDALELARHGRFNLVILDNWIERGSGIELCKEIRRFDSHTPIIFYSGAAYESDIQQALEAGAQFYLIKPTGIQVLVRTIEELTQCTSKQCAVGKMNIPRKQDIIALDERIEAKAKTLKELLDGSADLSEVGKVIATLNELLQSRELTKAILDNLDGRGALLSCRSQANQG